MNRNIDDSSTKTKKVLNPVIGLKTSPSKATHCVVVYAENKKKPSSPTLGLKTSPSKAEHFVVARVSQ